MAHIFTKVFDQAIQIPTIQLVDELLDDHTLAWQNVLAHPGVGLLQLMAVGGNDVVIAEEPMRVKATTAFHVVAWVNWSLFNGDFTEASRTMFVGKDDEETIAKIDAFKGRCRPVITDLITKVFYPNLVGVKYGFNVWFNNWVFIPSC